jgi:ABC-type polysaccharide transport system permease subunit
MRIATSSPATAAPLAARPAPSLPRARRGTQTWRAIRRGWQLYVMLLLPVLYLLVFHYWPMYGVQIAFRSFNVVDGITGSPWVGLAHFERFVTS